VGCLAAKTIEQNSSAALSQSLRLLSNLSEHLGLDASDAEAST
jgi:hypothetical protein